ncbi:hypothetical protein QCA50_004184 [Cerrena zonata]|uniref:DUF6533 domain-containing protein n=1 Tax=Cerrena zonata TaxID=2478898 RepID=A0AAW0GN92_9APHY
MFSTFESSGSIPLELQLTLQAQHVQYATVAFATVWVWDLLITIPEELALISGAFLTVPNLAYTIARIVTFSYQIVSAMFTVISASTVNCHTLLHVAAWLLALSTPCNALLFLVRIRGVFLHSPKIVWTFTALWSTTFASFLIPLNYIGGQVLLANQNCLVEETRPWAVIGFITILIFDTAVFVAISTKVLTVNMANTWGERARIFFGRRHLGRLSKVLLHSGQQFYLWVGTAVLEAV